MPTPEQTLTQRELALRRTVTALSRAKKAGELESSRQRLFDPPQTPQEHLFQATINDLFRHGQESPFSGVSDDGIETPA